MKRKLYSSALALGIAAAAGLIGTSPANAADPTTPLTFTVANTGSLSISAPTNEVNLGSVSPSLTQTSVSGSLGAVTVTDTQGKLVATWSATVSTTDFKTGGGTAAETIPSTNLSYDPGALGSLTVFPSLFKATPTPALTGSGTVMIGTGVGSNSVSWNPTVTIKIPSGAVVGTYKGTITHSVS